MARLLLLLTLIVFQQCKVHSVSFAKIDYKRAASDETPDVNNLIEPNTDNSLEESDPIDNAETIGNNQQSETLHGGLDEHAIDGDLEETGDNQVGETLHAGSDEENTVDTNDRDGNLNGNPELDTEKNSNMAESKIPVDTKPDSAATSENEEISETETGSIKTDQDDEPLDNTDDDQVNVDMEDDDDINVVVTATPTKTSTVIVDTNKPASTDATITPTVSTLKSTTEHGEAENNIGVDSEHNLEPEEDDDVDDETHSTVTPLSKSSTLLVDPNEDGKISTSTSLSKSTIVLTDSPESEEEDDDDDETHSTVTPLSKSSTLLVDPNEEKKISTLTPLSKSSTVLSDSPESEEGDDEHVSDDVSDDDKIVILTTRSTTDGSSRYPTNVNNVPNARTQQFTQSDFNNYLSQSTRGPTSPYYTQRTGMSRFPTNPQFYTNGVNAPAISPTTAQLIPNNSPTGPGNLVTMTHASNEAATRTTVPEKVNVPILTTSSETPVVNNISVTEQSNVPESLSTSIELSEEATTTINNTGNINVTTSAVKIEPTTNISTTNTVTTSKSESPSTQVIVETAPTESDTTTQILTTSIPPNVATTPLTTTTKKKGKGGHHTKKRPHANYPGGREGETIDVDDKNDAEEIKSTSVIVITTPTTISEETTASNNTDGNIDKGFIDKVIESSKKIVNQYGAVKVSLVLLTVLVVFFVLVFFCCKLCKKKGYKMRQRRLREYGQEKEFLLRDRKKNDRYSNDALTLLEGSSEDEF